MKKEENIVRVGKMYLSCLCGKHKSTSNCEVYLRNKGRWTKKMEENQLKELEEYIKKEHPDLYENCIKKKTK